MTQFFHAIQGRVLRSDSALPFLDALPVTATGDVPFDLSLMLTVPAAMPADSTFWYRSDDGDDATVIERAAESFVMKFVDGTSFAIDARGSAISIISAPADHGIADLATYALGPVLAFVLHLQGSVLLHASGVAFGSRSVLFCGPSGSGKSTTAAILEQQGYALLSDDLTEISASLPHQVLPSGGLLRLWSDSVERVYGDARALPQIAPSWEKRIRPIAEQTPRRLAAILLLEPGLRGTKPRLERLSSKEAWAALMANAFTARLPDEGLPERMADRIFTVLASVADSVPAYSFTPPLIESAKPLGAWIENALEAELQ